MDEQTIELLVKWGPIALVSFVFLLHFIFGVIKGFYKVTRRFIYVASFISLIAIFIGDITNFVLDFNVTLNDFGTVRDFISEFIEKNETINEFLTYTPELKSLIINHPQIIVNPILFVILVLVGLPLSFPIYCIYVIIWNMIAKFVFKREKYEKDIEGEFVRNEKGKKIKIKRKKRRLLGGLLLGAQGVVIFCISLMPLNFINRLYNGAKNKVKLDEGETLCGSIGFVDVDEKICKYIDIYNETILAKVSGENSFDKKFNEYLSTVTIDGEKVSLETEMSGIVNSAVLLNESGILDLLLKEEIDLENLDLSSIDFDKLDLAIDSLFTSYTISQISEAGVKYALNEVLNDKLVDLLKDDDIVSKLQYEDGNEIKDELKGVVGVVRLIVEKNIDNLIIDNKDNAVTIVNEVKDEDIEALLNKILSLRIVSKAMPSVIKVYGEKYGVNVPNEMNNQLNAEITGTFVSAINFVKTMELTKLEDITEGNIVDNLADSLFENGVLKDSSKESLAELLYDINSSYLFKDVISGEVNKMLKDKDYKVDARVIRYVQDKQDWLKELNVLEDAYALYDDYKTTDTIYYDKITSILNDMSGTKIMISVLPFVYDELLPKVGIEIDGEGLPIIDFDTDNEDLSRDEFYSKWEDELVVLKNVASSFEELELQSLEEIDVDLLDDENKVDALSTIMGEVYKSDLLKSAFAELMSEKVNEFVIDYDVLFTKEEMLSIDSKEKWNVEFTNINKILKIDFSDENDINSTNLSSVFDAVSEMNLFKTKKIDILKYAIKEGNFLSEEEYNSIVWPSDDQASIDSFWNNETSVLIDIVDKKDTIETLTSSVDLKTMNTTEIGDLLDTAMESNILNGIITNKVAKLFIDNGVKHDKDQGTDASNLKDSISRVRGWKDELDRIKSMVNISGDNIGEVAPGEEKNTLEKMFESIESSALLQNTRANLLLKAVNTANLVEIPSSVTIETLTADGYSKYNDEKAIIIAVSKNKEIFDNVGDLELKTIDTNKVGSLLDSVTSSIIFKDYVVGQISDVFTGNDVRDDRDSIDDTTYLDSNIASIKDWGKELAIIQSMLTMTKDTFDDKVNGKTNVEIMFDNIYSSALLQNTRANLLIKAIDTMNIDGVSIPSSVTISTLMANGYAQYDLETNVLKTFANNSTVINTLGDNISSISEDEAAKSSISSVLNVMKVSEIFSNKYVATVTDVLDTIDSEIDKSGYTDVNVDRSDFSNNYKNINWITEINSLSKIGFNISKVSGYNETSIDTSKEREETIIVIGETLGAIEASSFLGEAQASNVATKVVSALTGGLVTSISKGTHSSWKDAFNACIPSID